jgi:hypothetical protein
MVEQPPVQPPQPPPLEKRPAGTSHTGLFIGLGVGVLVLLLFGVCVAGVSSSSTKSTPQAPNVAPKTAAAAPAAAPTRDGSCALQPCANDNYGWIVVVGGLSMGVETPAYPSARRSTGC